MTSWEFKLCRAASVAHGLFILNVMMAVLSGVLIVCDALSPDRGISLWVIIVGIASVVCATITRMDSNESFRLLKSRVQP